VPALFVQNSFRDDPTVLVDPNFISTKDNILLTNYAVSLDSKYLAYQFNRNGSDWGEIKVINIKTGIHKNDHLKNVKFSNIAWKDNGFYYSVYPDQGIEKTLGQEIYFHQLETEQTEDKLIFKRTNNPNAYFNTFTTADERFLIIKEVDEIKDIINIFYIDFQSQMPALRPLLTKLSSNDNLTILDNRGDELIAVSRKDAENGMIIKISPENPREWNILIPEYNSALLLEVKLLEDKIITVYQSNRKQQIIFFDYQGKVLNAIQLPFGYSVNGFNGEKTDKKLLFSYEGYTQPKIVYILDTETIEIKPLRATVVNFDYTLYVTAELEYESFDGKKVPLFMVYKKGIDLKANNPTLLKAYGGFGLIEEPHFDPGIIHFLSEYGSVNDSLGFNNLFSYSPLNNIKDSINYPATLIMTSEFDDRVPPLHSYKFAAKLQNRKVQENPILLRIEKGAGHYGATSSLKDMLKADADMYDFILYYLLNN